MCCCEVVRGSTSYEVKFSASLQHDKKPACVSVCGLYVCVSMSVCVHLCVWSVCVVCVSVCVCG